MLATIKQSLERHENRLASLRRELAGEHVLIFESQSRRNARLEASLGPGIDEVSTGAEAGQPLKQYIRIDDGA